MAYIPPDPGSTTAGQATPAGVSKQDVHITDLPPEIRKNFLKSMVFFPSMVGAGICLLMFVGWLTIFKPKEPTQYALELDSSDMRRRQVAAREMSERITPYGETHNSKIYVPETLTALLEIMANPDLDNEAFEWSPSGSIKQDKEKTSIRWWAAYMTGHVAGKLPDPADKDRAYEALTKALDERGTIAIYAAQGLLFMREVRAVDALSRHLESDPDYGLRYACAKALGAIGEYQLREGTAASSDVAERIRNDLANAYQRENAMSKKDDNLLDNLAIALAKLRDRTGIERIRALQTHANPEYRAAARYLLESFEKPAK